jgi:hypothetical protein
MDKTNTTMFDDYMSNALDNAEAELNTKPYPEMNLDELAEILSLTIKEDYLCKTIAFLGMLSAYTYDSQLNISFNGPSSSGKTYITTEVAELFPSEDKIEINGASPTALFYQQGEDDKDEGYRKLVLENKILIFYELPDQKVQARLRSIASHDNYEQTHMYTNKTKNGTNKTDKIKIVGFPAMFYCSTSLRINEQEQTREFLLSPEQSQKKIAAAIEFQNERGKDEQAFNDWLESQQSRKRLMERILAIRDEDVKYIKLPDNDELKTLFMQGIGQYQERHTRDFVHIQQLTKAIALLNIWQRKQSDGSYMATQNDVTTAIKLWQQISVSQMLGVPPTVLRFYEDYILKLHYELKQTNPKGKIGFSPMTLSSYYIKHAGKLQNQDELHKQILPQLEASGLIDYEKPENGDKRSKWIYPVWNVQN